MGRTRRATRRPQWGSEMTKQQKPMEPDDAARRVSDDEDDVEGHNMIPLDPGSARHLASARERDIRSDLARRQREHEARPHKR
jgi:hypothetical protein